MCTQIRGCGQPTLHFASSLSFSLCLDKIFFTAALFGRLLLFRIYPSSISRNAHKCSSKPGRDAQIDTLSKVHYVRLNVAESSLTQLRKRMISFVGKQPKYACISHGHQKGTPTNPLFVASAKQHTCGWVLFESSETFSRPNTTTGT